MPKLVMPLLDNDAAFLSTAAAATALAGVSIETLNSQCFCISLDKDALRETLESTLGQPGLFELVQQRCPHLFATHPVFIAPAHLIKTAAIELARTRPQTRLLTLHPGTVISGLSQPFKGASAARPASLAARELLSLIDRLAPADSGNFFAYNGERLPW